MDMYNEFKKCSEYLYIKRVHDVFSKLMEPGFIKQFDKNTSTPGELVWQERRGGIAYFLAQERNQYQVNLAMIHRLYNSPDQDYNFNSYHDFQSLGTWHMMYGEEYDIINIGHTDKETCKIRDISTFTDEYMFQMSTIGDTGYDSIERLYVASRYLGLPGFSIDNVSFETIEGVLNEIYP